MPAIHSGYEVHATPTMGVIAATGAAIGRLLRVRVSERMTPVRAPATQWPHDPDKTRENRQFEGLKTLSKMAG
jgi:hypothetical protein